MSDYLLGANQSNPIRLDKDCISGEGGNCK